MNLTLHINGKDYALDCPPHTTLLTAVRSLGFHSVKFGDEHGLSGADTVLLDGRPVNAAVMLAGAGTYLALFFLRYLALDRNTFGLSWIPGLTEFVIYIAVTTGVALLAGWLVSMFGLRAWRGTPRQAAGSALAFVWFVLYLLALPILLSFAVNGVTFTWTLPEFTLQYLGFLAIVQALFVSALGLMLVGVSAGVGKARKQI